MKVAITSYGEDLSSKLDLSFGRAKWFVVVDTNSGIIEAHSNKQNYNAAQGAGIQIFITDKDVKTVEDALSRWKTGNAREVSEATVEGHWV